MSNFNTCVSIKKYFLLFFLHSLYVCIQWNTVYCAAIKLWALKLPIVHILTLVRKRIYYSLTAERTHIRTAHWPMRARIWLCVCCAIHKLYIPKRRLITCSYIIKKTDFKFWQQFCRSTEEETCLLSRWRSIFGVSWNLIFSFQCLPKRRKEFFYISRSFYKFLVYLFKCFFFISSDSNK